MSQPSVILATASYDRTIRFWEAQTGHCYRTIYYPALPVHELVNEQRSKPQHVNRLEISPDKCHLAAACNPYIRLFDVNYRSVHPIPVRTFASHTSNVTAVGFQRDGIWMYSGSEDGTFNIWDLRAPRASDQVYERSWRSYQSVAPINTVVLHPNQTELITGDQAGNVRVWDMRVNQCSYELVPELGIAIRSLTVTHDGTMVVAANDRGICYVWGLYRGNQMMTAFEPLCKLEAHDAHILKCLISPRNKYLATASSDSTVKIWNVGDFKLEKTLIGHQRWVWDCAFSENEQLLVTASSDTTARLWSISTGREVGVYQGHHKATVCCALRD